MIEAELLGDLLAAVGCGVTIYMPGDPGQRDQRAPEVRLRNLIDTAEARLAGGPWAPGQSVDLVRRLREAAAGIDFARHGAPTIALFAAPAAESSFGVRIVPLPQALPELVVVGAGFHIKPILPLLAANQRFNVLALSRGKVRLLAATPFAWTELPLTELPPEVQAELDARPAADVAPGTEGGEEARMALLLAERNVAAAVRGALRGDPAPVVLVADPHVGGNFLQHAQLTASYPAPLQVNPFAMTEGELHAKVLEVMRPELEADLAAALDQVNARLGTAEPTVAIRLEEIVGAARAGRVDVVVVAEDEALWGSFDPSGGVVAHGTPGPGDEDLLNLAAVLTLRAGGRAFAVPRARLPRQVPAVATYRF